MHLIDQQDSGIFGTSARELSPIAARAVTGTLPGKILSLLAKHPHGLHARAIAQQLKEQEQTIHYHIRNMRKIGAIMLDHVEEGSGAAAKVLRITSGAFCVRYCPLEPMPGKAGQVVHKSLEPFIDNGMWNARIVIGSPDPHGPEGARSRDAIYAVDLALFLGLFLSTPPKDAVILDTELSDWKSNLIVLGGPVVNKAAEPLAAVSPMPYDRTLRAFISKRTKHAYDGENVGIIARMPNPNARGKWILHIAGKRNAGTRSAVLALTHDFAKVSDLLLEHASVVVEGIDANSDGSVDKIRILE